MHPESWASPAKSARAITFFAHATTPNKAACGFRSVHLSLHSDVHLHQTINNSNLFVLVRSGRSVGPFGPPEEEKGIYHPYFVHIFYMFFLFLENWKLFLGLHGICSMSATNQCQLIWRIIWIFHSVRSSALWGGLRHAVTSKTPVCVIVARLVPGTR